jgi:hypothetical protein
MDEVKCWEMSLRLERPNRASKVIWVKIGNPVDFGGNPIDPTDVIMGLAEVMARKISDVIKLEHLHTVLPK